MAAMRPVPSVEVAKVTPVLLPTVPPVFQMWPFAEAFCDGLKVSVVVPKRPSPLPRVAAPKGPV